MQPYREYRQEVRHRYGYRCGYCGISEAAFGSVSAFWIDHFEPKSAFSELEYNPKNLVYSCFECNKIKGVHWGSKEGQRILQTLDNDYEHHVERLPSGEVRGKTADGRSTIELLQLNRTSLVRWRLREDRAVRDRQEAVRRFFDLHDRLEALQVSAVDKR